MSLPRLLAGTVAAITALAAFSIPASASPAFAKPRTVVTTDMEQDDLASLIRYLLYTNDLDT